MFQLCLVSDIKQCTFLSPAYDFIWLLSLMSTEILKQASPYGFNASYLQVGELTHLFLSAIIIWDQSAYVQILVERATEFPSHTKESTHQKEKQKEDWEQSGLMSHNIASTMRHSTNNDTLLLKPVNKLTDIWGNMTMIRSFSFNCIILNHTLLAIASKSILIHIYKTCLPDYW